MTGNRGPVGSFANRYLKYAQVIRSMRGAVKGERHGGARGRQINYFGNPGRNYAGSKGLEATVNESHAVGTRGG